MTLSVKLFARARELAGTSLAELPFEAGQTVEELLSALVEQYPDLGSLRSSLLVAIDNDYVTADTVIPAEAEIACFPPVSGG